MHEKYSTNILYNLIIVTNSTLFNNKLKHNTNITGLQTL